MPSPFVRNFLFKSVQLALNESVLDQTAMKWIIAANPTKETYDNVGFLNKALFSSGYTLKWTKLNHRLNIFPLIVHMNWTGRERYKKNQLQNSGLWFIFDEQFARYKVPIYHHQQATDLTIVR